MKLCVRVPATIANLGPGFDVFAIALSEPYEKVTVTTYDSSEPLIEIVSGGKYRVSEDILNNTAGLAAQKFLEDVGFGGKVVIELEKNIRPGGGLGSSAASAAGAVFALNTIFNRVDTDTLIRYASFGETVSSGTIHYDNVSASVLGGLVLSNGENFVKIRTADIPIAVVTPSVELKTSDSRKALGESITIADLKTHISSTAFLLHAFMKNDISAIGKFVNMENVVERRRAELIKGYWKVKEAALKHGAYGVSISGSGPSVFAIAPEDDLVNVASSMKEAFLSNGMEASAITTKSSDVGSSVVV